MVSKNHGYQRMNKWILGIVILYYKTTKILCDSYISNKNSYGKFLLFVGARSNSQRLRADVDNLQTQCANDMWSAWNNTNTSLQQRVTETTEAHNKLQSHLSKEMQEIYDQARLNFLSNYIFLYGNHLDSLIRFHSVFPCIDSKNSRFWVWFFFLRKCSFF